ncbi:zinc-ribbon domain-containing protein, partial [Pseudobacteroides cellulosolvens]
MSKRKKLSENAALMQQWDFEKNVRGPECFTEYSHVKVWWKCIQGHS